VGVYARRPPRPNMLQRTLTVYIRQHCHLCTEMARALVPYQQRFALSFEFVDVDEDPVLCARYGEKVPVLADGEQEICQFFLSDQALVEHLGTPVRAPASVSGAPRNERIHAIARQIPKGRVATYGQLAAIEGRSTARMVGNAMAALPAGSDVPWQRVLNSRGMLSPRSGGGGTSEQKRALMAEGVLFDRRDRVDFAVVGWSGPEPQWLADNDCHHTPPAGVSRGKH